MALGLYQADEFDEIATGANETPRLKLVEPHIVEVEVCAQQSGAQ